MTPPYQQPGANVAFWTLFGLFVLGEYAARFRSRFNRSGTRAERWSFVVVVACVAGGMLGAFALADWNAAAIGAGRWPLFVLGLALMAAGVCVRNGQSSRSAASSPSTFVCIRTRWWSSAAPTVGCAIPPTAD